MNEWVRRQHRKRSAGIVLYIDNHTIMLCIVPDSVINIVRCKKGSGTLVVVLRLSRCSFLKGASSNSC